MASHPNRRRSSCGTVTLIRQPSGFANIKDRFAVMAPGHIYDDNAIQEVYYLPDDYVVAECNLGTLEIYDPLGRHCAIVWHPSTGRPQLVNEGRDRPVLKRKVAA